MKYLRVFEDNKDFRVGDYIFRIFDTKIYKIIKILKNRQDTYKVEYYDFQWKPSNVVGGSKLVGDYKLCVTFIGKDEIDRLAYQSEIEEYELKILSRKYNL